MTLLLWLTLGYAAVLVLTLAVGLAVAWARLRAIDRSLGAARAALGRVRGATADLDERVAPLRETLDGMITALEEAGEDLSQAKERVVERAGAAAGSAA